MVPCDLAGLACFDAMLIPTTQIHRPCDENEQPSRCHHAIVCTECGSAREFHSDALERALGEVRRSTRYRVLGHLLELRGLCRDCQEPG